MKRMILIRHSETVHNVEGTIGGWSDYSLSKNGEEHAKRTAVAIRELQLEPTSIIFCSDLLRAKQTAEFILQQNRFQINYIKELRELNNGEAAGLSSEQAKIIENEKTYPLEDWIPYRNAESWNMMVHRIENCMKNIAVQCNTTGIIITHANSGIAIINWWLNIKECCRNGLSYRLNTSSITELGINQWHEKTIFRLNDDSHISEIG